MEASLGPAFPVLFSCQRKRLTDTVVCSTPASHLVNKYYFLYLKLGVLAHEVLPYCVHSSSVKQERAKPSLGCRAAHSEAASGGEAPPAGLDPAEPQGLRGRPRLAPSGSCQGGPTRLFGVTVREGSPCPLLGPGPASLPTRPVPPSCLMN